MLDNLIWLLCCIQASAIILLWLGIFNKACFIFAFSCIAILITYARAFTFRIDSKIEKPHKKTSTGKAIMLATFTFGLIYPIKKYISEPAGWDALAYHLPMAAQWVQTKHILTSDSRVWFYPGGYELITAVFFMLTGNSSLWYIGDIISWSIVVFSLYRLGLTLGFTDIKSSLATSSVALSQLFTRYLGIGDNDLYAAGLIFYTISAVLELSRINDGKTISKLFLGAGLVASSKYSMLIWLPIFYMIGSRALLRQRERRSLATIAAIIFGLLVTGSFLIRNLVVALNPFYPIGFGSLIPWGDTSHIVSLPISITPEQIRSSSLFMNMKTAWAQFLKQLLSSTFVVPTLLSFNAAFLAQKQNQKLNYHRNPLWLFMLLSLLIFVMQPLVVETIPGTHNQISNGWSLRFALPWIGLLAFILYNHLPERASIILSILVISITCHHYIYVNDSHSMLLYATLILCLCIAFSYTKEILISLPLGCYFFYLVSASNSMNRESFYSYQTSSLSRVINYLRKEENNNNIIISTGMKAWPLIGMKFQNRVISVGMSLDCEAYKNAAEKNSASIIISSRGYGDSLNPDYGSYYPDPLCLHRVLGEDWELDFNDGFTQVFRRASINKNEISK